VVRRFRRRASVALVGQLVVPGGAVSRREFASRRSGESFSGWLLVLAEQCVAAPVERERDGAVRPIRDAWSE